jgi:hypothetical protein
MVASIRQKQKYVYIVLFCFIFNIDSKLGHTGWTEQIRKVTIPYVRGTTRRTLREKTNHRKQIQIINN